MSERNIRHVEEIFSGRGIGDGKPVNLFDKKNVFTNVSKKRRAPQPPQGANALPKIGNYQPKIYLEPKPGSPTEIESKPNVTVADVHHEHSDFEKKDNPPEISKETFIIGDKDIPIIIEEKTDARNTSNNEEETPVPMPRRKRRAPSAPDLDKDTATTNPLFGRSLSQSSDTTRLGKNFEIQGGDIDFAYGIDNPGYERREYTSTKPDHSPVTSSYQNGYQNEEDGMPYIPPPDYDDEEITMDFDDEPEFDTSRFRNNRPYSVVKDYEGEDFSKYLNDDLDYEIEQSRRKKSNRPPDRLDQKFLPRPPPREGKKGNKQKKKSRKEPEMKRNTIRDFTFSDSKIGWGDRTVKSTSAKGRYIKREKDRRRIDITENTEDRSTAPSSGSYEEFLRMKNKMDKDSPNSSDSGVEVGHESQFMDMYLHSKPKQYKMVSKYEERKPSVWKRLTLRFKKSVNVTNSGGR